MDAVKKYEMATKEAEENYIKSKEILKGYFKALYENAGMEWNEKNDEEIEFVVESIIYKAFFNAGEILASYNEKLGN